MLRNTAGQFVGCQLITRADGTDFTGSVTVSVTGDNGTQTTGSVGSGACTHEGKGWHSYAPAQAETNYTHVAFTFQGTGAITASVQIYPQAYSEIADAVLDRNMATGTDSGSASVRTVRQALRALRNRWTNSAGTYTVYKENDSTTSWTSTTTGDAAADPVVESNPAD